MNIDFNILSIIVLSCFSAYFGISFFRALLRERKVEMQNRISEVEDQYWREHEKMWQRINHLERFCRDAECCKATQYPVKNHYNTGA